MMLDNNIHGEKKVLRYNNVERYWWRLEAVGRAITQREGALFSVAPYLEFRPAAHFRIEVAIPTRRFDVF